jgi:hypothetical protein
MRQRRAARGRTSTPIAMGATIDPSRRLSEGALVQASVRARLLGIPLLRLDATVALLPAAITAPSSAISTGNGLAEAVRSINDGEEVLARCAGTVGARSRARDHHASQAKRAAEERQRLRRLG